MTLARLSIRARLTLWYSVVLLAVLAVAGIAVVSLHSRLGRERVDDELAAAAETAQGVLRNEINERLALPEAVDDMLEELNLPAFGIAVLNPAGELLGSTNARAPHLEQASIKSAPSTPAFADDRGDRMRILGVSGRHDKYDYRVVVWTSMQPLARESATLQQAIWLGVPVAIALAAIVGSVIAKHSLQPLDDALRMQRAFMADASHQLRNPVSIVRTSAQVTLSREERSSDEYRESLEIIGRQSERLSKMVDDMFMLAMVDAQGRPLQRAPLYVNEIIDDVVRDAQPLTIERGVTIARDDSEDVPFEGDEELIKQMIWNLVENAIRHSPAGGAIRLSLARSAAGIEITVSDDGPGIAAADRDRVFNRFVRLESASGGAGAGLGLPIAKWIAEAHGGGVVLDDTPHGCRFRITLPVSATS